MCDEEVMSLIAEKLGSDLIVIPSSIHETIILKETENVSRDPTGEVGEFSLSI